MGLNFFCSSTLSIVGLGVGVALLTAGAILSFALPLAVAPVMTVMGGIAFASSWASISQDLAPPAQTSAAMWAQVKEIPAADAASPVEHGFVDVVDVAA